MILSGKEIVKRMGKEIIIKPFFEHRVGPNSYNLSLHQDLYVYESEVLDMKQPNTVRKITIPEEGMILEKDTLYLGRTNE